MSARGRRIAAIVIAGMALASLAGVRATPPSERGHGPLPQQAYLWQRHWDNEVRFALDRSRNALDGLVVLAAEVAWEGAVPRATRVAFEADRLQRRDAPVGLAVRIRTFPGKPSAYRHAAVPLGLIVEDILRDARAHGLIVAELQIDYDAPEAHLAAYRLWVRRLRALACRTPLVITALPCWLDHDAFVPLVQAADGYVLQVHALQRPHTPEGPFVLCDPDSARARVEQAGALGIPFRIALPTYGYAVLRDASGRFMGLSAETLSFRRPASDRLTLVQADPAAMQALAAGWQRSRPRALEGILWYRLPVEGDRLNWPWSTFQAVRSGRPLRTDAVVIATQPEAGLVELAWRNRGNLPVALDRPVAVTWEGGTLLAGDGSADYRAPDLACAPGTTRFRPVASGPLAALAPGDHRPVGWLRFDGKVTVHVAAEVPHP
ncbi:MAG: DUF3142 domain-containing protein [Planctomycetota bacterium]